jgi:hypothetical protein
MSEFKYACPVCGQHIMCDASRSGSVMECPTCFQKITVPQAPDSDDQKLIITGTKAGGERPIPKVPEGNTRAVPPAKSFPGVTVVLIILVCIAAAVGFVYRGTIFKSTGDQTGGPTNQDTAAANEKEALPPPPIVGLASVIFAKGDSIVLGSETAAAEVKIPARASFLAAFKADLAHPLPLEGPFELSSMPAYGRKVPGATGEIQYHRSFHGGLVIGVTLKGLLPAHEYLLTLNGDSQRAGNGHLPDQLRGSAQRYYDFITVTTDPAGSYHATFGVGLPAGPYDVSFFVKDTADFKIVLQHDFFRFIVE